MSCPEDGWDEHAGRHLGKGKFLHCLWLWEVRRNLEEKAAEGDIDHEPLREERGAGSHETQAGSGEGAGQLCCPWAITLFPLGLQEMQFVWRGSRSLWAQQEIFTHVLDGNGYCP